MILVANEPKKPEFDGKLMLLSFENPWILYSLLHLHLRDEANLKLYRRNFAQGSSETDRGNIIKSHLSA